MLSVTESKLDSFLPNASFIYVSILLFIILTESQMAGEFYSL